MRVLAIGDVIAKPGRTAVKRLLPEVVREERIDVVIANGENLAGGIGTTEETAQDLVAAGVHVVTGGNHTWKHRAFRPALERRAEFLRPANYPEGAPGRGFAVYQTGDGRRYAVINLICRAFMEPVENPFHVVDRILAQLDARVILVDLHGEASSEKRAIGWHLDGRVSAVWGTHTHVPTADEEVLPGGTAYLTDVGMTGPYASVIGLDPTSAVAKFVHNLPVKYQVADGNVQLRALLVDVDDETGRAREARRIRRDLSA